MKKPRWPFARAGVLAAALAGGVAAGGEPAAADPVAAAAPGERARALELGEAAAEAAREAWDEDAETLALDALALIHAPDRRPPLEAYLDYGRTAGLAGRKRLQRWLALGPPAALLHGEEPDCARAQDLALAGIRHELEAGTASRGNVSGLAWHQWSDRLGRRLGGPDIPQRHKGACLAAMLAVAAVGEVDAREGIRMLRRVAEHYRGLPEAGAAERAVAAAAAELAGGNALREAALRSYARARLACPDRDCAAAIGEVFAAIRDLRAAREPDWASELSEEAGWIDQDRARGHGDDYRWQALALLAEPRRSQKAASRARTDLHTQGRWKEAVVVLEAFADVDAAGNPQPEPDTYAFILIHRGRYADALRVAERSGKVHPHTVALAYTLIGQPEKAVEILGCGDEVRDSAAYYCGYVHSDAGRHEDAVRYYARAGNDRITQANLLRSLRALGRLDEALALFERHAQPSGFKLADLMMLMYGADALLDAGLHERALAAHREALLLAHDLHLREGTWRSWWGMAQAAAALGRNRLAIFYGKMALREIQSLRSDVTTLDRALQKSFLWDKDRVYRGVAELLLGAGRLDEAEHILHLRKGEEFYDFIGRDDAAGVRAPLVFTRLEAARFGALDAYWTRRVTLEDEELALRQILLIDRSEAQRRRIAAVRAELRQMQGRDRAIVEALPAAFDADAAAPERFGAAERERLDAPRAGLRRLGHAAALHYLVGEERTHALLVLPGGYALRDIAVGRAELERRVAAYRRQLQDPRSDPRAEGQALYRLLLEPLIPELERERLRARTLMLSLDGALRYLPMAALHDGERWLVQRYALSLLTVTDTERLAAAPRRNWRVAAFGSSRGGQGMAPLPAVAAELNGIVAAGPGDPGVLPGQVRLDEEFTADSLAAALRQSFPAVHLASHFAFRPGDEKESFLLTGDNGRLSLAELRGSRYSFAGVDLVTLSACETALDSISAYGREIEGLGMVVQKQGAAAVLATLWPVADASTGLFMQHMYAARQRQKLSKAEAIRQVQMAFIGGGVAGAGDDAQSRGMQRMDDPATPAGTFTADPAKPYAHPYYWAPFILMGNWR